MVGLKRKCGGAPGGKSHLEKTFDILNLSLFCVWIIYLFLKNLLLYSSCQISSARASKRWIICSSSRASKRWICCDIDMRGKFCDDVFSLGLNSFIIEAYIWSMILTAKANMVKAIVKSI